MPTTPAPFSGANVWRTPLRDLRLQISGTPLEPILAPADILRYLRHEMGHVVNYAYRLYDDGAWVERFGAITQPYVEHYRPEPFSRRFVRHLPGWYAQKHPVGPHLHHIEHQIRRPPGQARDQLLEVAIYAENGHLVAPLAQRPRDLRDRDVDLPVAFGLCMSEHGDAHGLACSTGSRSRPAPGPVARRERRRSDRRGPRHAFRPRTPYRRRSTALAPSPTRTG